MQPIDLLLEPRWLVPVEPHGAVLEGHAVAVDGERILAVLPIGEARARYAPREHLQLSEHALIPGLVNAHAHNPMTLMRGLADDLPLMRWLQEHIWPAEAKAIGPEFVRDGIELAVAEMLRGGTTCCNENYFFPDVQAATYRRLGFRAMIGLPIIEFPSAWAATRDEYFDRALAVHDEFKGEPLLGTAWAPHAPYTVADEVSSASACCPTSSTCRCTCTCTRRRTRSRRPGASAARARSRACRRSAWSTTT